MKKRILYFALFFTFLSCVKEVPLTSEESNPKIVVNAIFNDKENIKVFLKKSVSILEEANFVHLSNVKVTLTSDDLLEEFSNASYFESDFNTEVGKTYSITASADGYEPVEASTEVPPLAPVAGIDTTINEADETIQLNISINDNPTQENYYSVKIIFMGNEEFSSNSTVAFSEEAADLTGVKSGSEFFFSDKTFNGEVFTFSGVKEYRTDIPLEYYVIEVNSLSRDLYHYKLSYFDYLKSQELPFTEPVQIYSNIKNGIGIFAGQSVYRDTIWVN